MLAAQEFQAVILAGFGSRLYPLADGDTVPKALLPVANRPMIAYQLEWLEEANIRDIIIAAYPGARGKINGVVQSMYEGSTEARVQIVEVPENCGSADALRSIKSRIKTDFFVISCDLITDIPVHYLINSFSDRPVSKDDGLGEFIGIDDQSSRLLIMASKADLDDCLELRTSLIEKFPVIHIHSQLRDAHLYIFRRWVIDLVVKDRNISSIKNDLVPLLLEFQHRESIVKKEGIDKFLSTNLDLFGRAMLYSTSGHEPTPHNVTCNAVVYRDGFTARGNTIWSYSELNRHVIKNSTDVRVQASSEVSAKTQVGQDSLVGEGSKIDERCSVKKSVIGNHCTIGKNVKLTNSIIMDYVHIEDNVKIEESIICSNAKIGRRAMLKDCRVGAMQIVPAETVGKNEVFAAGMNE
ncbi:hypothetical protein BASA83_011552 [Batrachochytrium salamandrivorans]|nr:hypothetical protein BASA83_011552 [Batrachochytrium salamandrivorans]